jgi:hypothetical protein
MRATRHFPGQTRSEAASNVGHASGPPSALLALALWLLLCLSSASAAERLVWKLGEPDRSDHEFTTAADARTNREIVVQLGGGRETQQWPRFHPGSGNGAFGARPYRYVLTFDLPAATPGGVFYLDLSLLFRQPRVPALDLDINGHLGRFYFEPDPTFELGSVDDEFNAIRSAEHRKLALAARFFKPGENRIAFVAMDDPPTVVHNRNVGGSGDSGFFYDALTLSNDSEAAPPENLDVSLTPTVFYLQSGKTVQEQCCLIVRFPPTWPGAQARIAIGKFDTNIAMPAPGEFGELRCWFLVPAELPAGNATIELSPVRPHPDPAGPNNTAATLPPTVAAAGARDDALQTFTVAFRPAKKWKVFYAPNEHLDVGYTDYRSKVAEVHARSMDELLRVLDAHPKYRFNLDGSWIADQWLDLRSTRHTAQLLPHVRAGQVGMNAFYSSIATEYPSLEESFRNLYLSKELEQSLGIPFDFALVSDVPSVSWSVPSVLASAGIRYFANGGNQDRGPMVVHGHWSVRSPFWWEGPDGQRVLAWFSSHYHQFKALFGLPPAPESGKGGLARFLKSYQQAGYVPDAVLLYGTEVENLPTEYDDACFVERWNAEFAWPKIITCQFSDFFRYIEHLYATNLPVVRGTGGAYWADNFGIIAAATSRDRANQARAVAAESMAALTCALAPKLRFSRELDREIWRDLLLYAEHNFGIGGLNDKPECDEAVGIVREKEDQTVRAQWNIDKLLRRGLSQLADQIETEGQNLIVFNPLAWKRGGLVRYQVPAGTTLTNLTTRQLTEFEVVAEKDGFQTIRFLAADVPPLGYQVYRFGRGRARHVPPAGQPASNTVENRYYRITLAPARAAISSIYDKELGRELVDSSSPYMANEYLFVSGGGTEAGRGRGAEDTQLLHPFRWLPPAELTIHRSENGGLLGVEKTPWGQRVRLSASALHTPRIETEILLPDARKELEVRNAIQVDLLYAKQASYFAFPWALAKPTFRYDIPNGFVNPARDLLEGGCSDWFAVQHLVNAEDSGLAISVATPDAPLVCLGDIYRGRWLPRFTNESPVVFSYALNNYWSPKWAGKKVAELQYRYTLTSNPRFEPAVSARWGREARCPLELAALKSSDKLPGLHGHLPPTQAGFVTLSPDNLVLTALKPAEDGQGLVVRILETGGCETDGVLDLPLLKLVSAHEANAVEVKGRALTCASSRVRFHIKPNQALTLRLKVESVESRNPKSEIRDPKVRRERTQAAQRTTCLISSLCSWYSSVAGGRPSEASDFGFGISAPYLGFLSDFGFRTSELSLPSSP